VSGLLIGTVGFAAEYGFSHIWMPIPWTEAILPGAVALAAVAVVAGGLLGAMVALALRGELPGRAERRAVTVGALVAVAALIANGLATSAPRGMSASVALNDVPGQQNGREVEADVRLHPPTAADEERWLSISAWQGGGLVVNRLERIGPGHYRTTEPIPVHGQWKAMLRLQSGRTIAAVPIYMPADPAIPAPAVAAPARFTRSFEPDIRILQRERKRGVPGWLTVAAPLVVLAISLGLLSVLAIGLSRVGRLRDEGEGAGRSSSTPSPSRGRRSPPRFARPA
jgi:hypothetical protein